MCVCVCVCVCLSVKSHLASGAFVRPENAVKYSVCNVCQKFVGFSLKLFRSRATALPALYGYREVGHFLSGNTRVSLPSYKRYQRLQRLKRANIWSVFAQTMASQLYGELARTTAGPRPIVYFVEHAHNASLSDNT